MEEDRGQKAQNNFSIDSSLKSPTLMFLIEVSAVISTSGLYSESFSPK